ncbi:hypothetical protein EOS_25745 [Caballeronia mineralivorans PML1(12)]|uniref:Uncharacterized protein n=1 Tax=Caballeronia mineralivorans PML1(12) TaxID=908627 RepID=A0A0J1FU60_9BURK|nr:hypothetical protein EOS_25745 [Caballeronia mineralivorans PML1(12)]
MANGTFASRRGGVIAASIQQKSFLQASTGLAPRLLQSLVRTDPTDTAGFDASTHAVEQPCIVAIFIWRARAPIRSVFAQAQRIAREP